MALFPDSKLKARLLALRYHQALVPGADDLVGALLDDLIAAREQAEAERGRAEEAAQLAAAAENQLYPLRRENGRLERDNAKLHSMIIAQAEAADGVEAELRAHQRVLAQDNVDARFLAGECARRAATLERAVEKLRKKLAGALDDNGTVLPHACEVRWTGMRQGMVSHSPLPPADVAPARVAAEGRALASNPALAEFAARVRVYETEADEARRGLLEAREQLKARGPPSRVETWPEIARAHRAHALRERKRELAADLRASRPGARRRDRAAWRRARGRRAHHPVGAHVGGSDCRRVGRAAEPSGEPLRRSA